MIRRTRMYAAALAVSIAGGVGAITVAPAQGTTTAPTDVNFSCSVQSLLGSAPLGTVLLPVDLSVLNNITVPVGTTLAPAVGTLGLGPLLQTLGVAINQLTGFTSNLVAQIGSSQVPLALNAATGALQVPGVPLPGVPGNLPVTLARGSSITFGLLGGVLGTVSCLLPQASGQLANILVRTPSQITSGTTIGAGPVTWGGSGLGAGGGAASGAGASGAAHNLCLQPLARSSRPARVKARTARKSAPSKVAPKIVVRAAKRATGTVVACYGTSPIAASAVKHGRAVLRLPRFYPGHYRVAVRYLGSGAFCGASSKVRLTVS